MRWALLVVALLTVSCVKRDLDALCKLAQEVLAEPRLGPAERAERFAQQVKNNAFSSEVRALLAEAMSAPAASRADVFERGASDLAGKRWSCAPLRIVLAQ